MIESCNFMMTKSKPGRAVIKLSYSYSRNI